MEVERLQRAIQLFDRSQIKVRAIVTDRHRQIAAWLKKNWQSIKHCFDCWHIAKSSKKKLKLPSKRKGFEHVGEWTKSIVNHYHWSVMSTEIDDKDLIEAQWKSLIRHIQNKHEGHGHTFQIVLDKTLLKDSVNSSAFGQTPQVEGYHSLIN